MCIRDRTSTRLITPKEKKCLALTPGATSVGRFPSDGITTVRGDAGADLLQGRVFSFDRLQTQNVH
eukprot:4058427-Prymnesium_polylepis.1